MCEGKGEKRDLQGCLRPSLLSSSRALDTITFEVKEGENLIVQMGVHSV